MVSPWNKPIKTPQKNPRFPRSHSHLVWGIPTPLKNDGLRQLGLFAISGKINMFQTTNQS
jgi:hypothetical protein